MVHALYIHIPFCIRKCCYCDFYSIAFNSESAARYVDAQCEEILLRNGTASNLATIYIGGGTPSVLPPDLILQIMGCIEKVFGIANNAEITIEANPGTINEEGLRQLLEIGFNRISIGIQSLDDNALGFLGRSHRAHDAVEAVNCAKRAGFANISVDLIYGVPGHSIVRWQDTLRRIVDLQPQHISMYELTPEGDTPLFADIQAGIVKLLDDEQIADMYYLGKDFLESCGYIHYEISNFAQPTYECRHNINYWDRGGYLGIGASAHSFINDVRCANVSDVDLYIEGMRDRRLPIAEKLAVDRDGTLKELFMLGLRKTEGIMLHAIPLERRLSIEKAVEELIIHGLAALKDGHLKLTRKGLLVSNEVIVRVWSHIDSIHS